MKAISTLSDLDAALRETRRPVVLFKHSTQCPVSAEADEEYRAFASGHPDAAVFTHLDLLAHRDISKEIADRLGIRHESPQLIVVRGARVSGVLNHDAITRSAIAALVGA